MSTDRETRAENLAALFGSFDAYDKMEDFSDSAIAELLLEHVWAHESMVSPRAALLEQAIDRLRKSASARAEGAKAERERIEKAIVLRLWGKEDRCGSGHTVEECCHYSARDTREILAAIRARTTEGE